MKDHDCETAAPPGYLQTGERQEGEVWRCKCGREWRHVCDEDEGCLWVLANGHPSARRSP